MQLWRELKERGYPGTARMVLVWAHQQPKTPAPSTPNRYRGQAATPVQETACSTNPPSVLSSSRTSSSRQFAWFLLKESASLTLPEQAVLEKIRQSSPELLVVREFAQQFQEIVKKRNASLLDAWLSSALESDQPPLTQFATGLSREKASILAALSLPWSNTVTLA